MAAITTTDAPRWDMTPYFPSLDSSEFGAAFDALGRRVAAFGKETEALTAGDGDTARFESLIRDYNELYDEYELISAYVHAFVTTDSRDTLALAKESELEAHEVAFRKAHTKLVAWIGTLNIDDLVSKSPVAKDHEYALRKFAEEARHQMSPEEEALAADLHTVGASAWSRMHGTVSSQIEVEFDGKKLPMSMLRNLAYDPDRDVRRRAYEAELTAWKENEVTAAFAMNGIKGQVNILCERRGWDSPLDEALFHANIDRSTLEAMMTAARESFPDFRRYLRAKAKALGIEKLAFYDIFGPVGSENRAWSYDEGAEFVAKQFGSYSEKMGGFARRSFRENWIDAEPRAGKRDGAYCMGTRGDESRILMNYKPSIGSVKTLAHELGHAYHNLCMDGQTALQKETPMTLAETASIFCETIVKNAALKELTEGEQVSILEGSLQGACQTVIDITSRFIFEQSVFEGRQKRELSAQELCERMLDAQKQTYGDGLDEDLLHPYMWAVKPHYYSTYSFYNFPYMFGLLFGLGLYAQYEQNPEEFKKGYDELLSSTGLADAATLAAKHGINIRTPDFWRSSLEVVRKDIDKFEQLV